MMRRLLLAAALLAATAGHAQIPPGQGGMVPGTNQPVPPFGSMAPNTGGMTTNPVAAGFTPSCSQSSNFLARTSGIDVTHKTAYDTLICNLQSQGVFAKLDVMYVFATSNTTTALLNLVSASFNGTANGSPSFASDAGYTGVDSSTTVFIDSGFNASTAGGNYSANSLHMSFWSNTSAQSSATGGNAIGIEMAAPADLQRIAPWYSDGNAYFGTGNIGGQDVTGVNVGSVGHFVANRSGAAAQQAYHNATSFGSNVFATNGLINGNLYVLADDKSGGNGGSALQIMSATFGGSLSSTDVGNLCHELNTYLHTIAGVASGIC